MKCCNFQVEIKFAAPQQKGTYNYNLLVRSDSYMDCDYSLDLKVLFYDLSKRDLGWSSTSTL